MYAVEFNAKIDNGKIEVPTEYLWEPISDVRVIMLYENPIPAKQNNSGRGNKSIKGIISQYANPELIPSEKEAWGEAAKEKYAVN